VASPASPYGTLDIRGIMADFRFGDRAQSG
jgi:hypothetical protein